MKPLDTPRPVAEVHRAVVRALDGAEVSVAIAVLEEIRLLVLAGVTLGALGREDAPLVVRAPG